MLRILQVHNGYRQHGGEESAVATEAALLRAHGNEVLEYRRSNDELGDLGVLTAAGQTVWSTRTWREVTQCAREFRPDMIHVHNTFARISPSVYWAAARRHVPIVQTLHNFRLLCAQAMFLRHDRVCEDCLGKLPWRGVVRKCYRDSAAQSAALVAMLGAHRALGTYRNKIDRYIALSDFSRRKFIAGGLPADKLVVKPNCVEVPHAPDGQRGGGLFVGRLAEEKGLAVLSQALCLVPHARCEIIGSGPRQQLVEDNAQLRLLGWRDPEFVYGRMRAAAYLVLPSICYEQFPRTLVEAYACGLPVIASRLGALAELVAEGTTGLLFEPGSADDLARQIAFAEANPQAMRRMGENARAEYEAKYTPQRNYRQLMEIYAGARAAAGWETAPVGCNPDAPSSHGVRRG